MNPFPEDPSSKLAREMMEQYRKSLGLNDYVSELEKMKRAALPASYMNPALETSMKVQEQLRMALAPNYFDDITGMGTLSEKLRKIVAGDIFETARDAVAQIDDLTGMKRIKELSQFPSTDYAGKLYAFRDSFFIDENSQAALIEKYSRLNDVSDYVKHLNPGLYALRQAQRSLAEMLPDVKQLKIAGFPPDVNEIDAAASALDNVEAASLNLEQFLAGVSEVLAKLNNPIVKRRVIAVVWWVLNTMIQAMVGGVLGYYVNSALANSPQAEKKAVQENARKICGAAEYLSDYRYVSAKELAVRQNPRSRSPSVGSLKFGYAVEVLKKEGDFTLIQWQGKGEDNDAQIQGWVFSRYLEKFK